MRTKCIIQNIVTHAQALPPWTRPSRLISEAKHGRAWLVLGWETAWEYQVL